MAQPLINRLVEGAVVIALNVEGGLDVAATEPNPYDATFKAFAAVETITARSHHPAELLVGQDAPLQSHKVQLPSDVVGTLPIFCFPEGAQIFAEAADMPQPRIHSFVLKECGMYAVTLTLHREVDARAFWLAWTCVRPVDVGAPITPFLEDSSSSFSSSSSSSDLFMSWFRLSRAASLEERISSPRRRNSRSERLFMPFSICLLTRWPYLTALKNALCAILPTIQAVRTDSLATVLEPLITGLAHVPVPPPGTLAIRCRLGTESLLIRPPLASGLPVMDWSARLPFLVFSPQDILLIFRALLFERRMLFFARDEALLVVIIETFSALLYPLRWHHGYVPVVPEILHSIVESPWPYVAGMNSSHYSRMVAHLQSENACPVIVNVDKRSVEVPADITVPELPADVVQLFESEFDSALMHFELECQGYATFGADHDPTARAKYDLMFQAFISDLFLKMMLRMLGNTRQFILFNTSPAIFAEDQFIASKPERAQDFYQQLCKTGSFKLFRGDRKEHVRDFFDSRFDSPKDEKQNPFLPDNPRKEFLEFELDLSPFILPSIQHDPTAAELSTVDADADAGTDQFSTDVHASALASLTRLIDNRESGTANPCHLQRLYLRGAYLFSQGNFAAAFADFDRILKEDASQFPYSMVLRMMYEMTESDFEHLLPTFFDHNEVWTSMKRQAAETDDFKRRHMLSSDPMADIGSIQEFQETIFQRPAVSQADFFKLLKLFGVTNEVTVAINLQQALRPIDPSESLTDSISSALCRQFISAWGDRFQIQKNTFTLPLEANEEVLKMQPLVRVAEKGTGTLVLTRLNLYFIPSHQQDPTNLTPVTKILKLEKGTQKQRLSGSLQSLTVTFLVENAPSPRHQPKASFQLSSQQAQQLAAAVATSEKPKAEEVPQSVMLMFFSERDEWFHYLKELQNAHSAAANFGGSAAVAQAVRNILLVETIARLTLARGVPASSADSTTDPSSQTSISSKAIKRLLTFNNEATPKAKPTHLLMQIDVSPDDVNKLTVESLTFVPSREGGFIWCGLGTGAIQIVSMPAGKLESRLRIHSQRIMALKYSKGHVWSASLSRNIVVINAKTHQGIHAFNQLSSFVSAFEVEDGDRGESIWCALLDGSILRISCQTYQLLSTFMLPIIPAKAFLLAILIVNDTIWCGLDACILIIDKTSGVPLQRPRFDPQLTHSTSSLDMSLESTPAPKTPQLGLSWSADEPMQPVMIITAASQYLVRGSAGEVWSGSPRHGLLQVWDSATYEKVTFGGEWRIDCNRLYCLVSTSGHIVGSGDNGALYVWDRTTHWFTRQFTGHSDSARSLCVLEDGLIVSGSGSRDGSIIVWKPLAGDPR
eukprot:m.405008 g.405008  ORF g.405008 m.405008 type:complete len:1345 (-) comp56485_c0_seq3:624-4658(-)